MNIGIWLAERGFIPDFLLRIAVRLISKARIKNTNDFSDSEINGDSELFTNYTNQRWLASTWKYIANYYKDEAVIGGYDLLNEPARAGVALSLIHI